MQMATFDGRHRKRMTDTTPRAIRTTTLAFEQKPQEPIMRVRVEGRDAEVEFLAGAPWYVQVRPAKTGLWRTIWHRSTGRVMGDLARLVVATANAA